MPDMEGDAVRERQAGRGGEAAVGVAPTSCQPPVDPAQPCINGLHGRHKALETFRLQCSPSSLPLCTHIQPPFF